MANINTRIVLCSKTEAEWQNNTTVILSGEIAISSDKRKIKIGDGSHYWSQLKYANYTPEEVDNLISSNIANLRSDLTGHISDNNKHFRNSEEKGQFISIKDGLDSGTAGTVLTKSSSGDYDFEWSTVPQMKAEYESEAKNIKLKQVSGYVAGSGNLNIPQKVTDLQDHLNYVSRDNLDDELDERLDGAVFYVNDSDYDEFITAQSIKVADESGYFKSETVEGVLHELKQEVTSDDMINEKIEHAVFFLDNGEEEDLITAGNIHVIDEDENFENNTVEGVLGELNTLKADGIVCCASGEVANANDCSDKAIQSIKIYGKSTQKTLSGKNLLSGKNQGNILGEQIPVKNGETYTVLVKGSSTDSSTLYVNIYENKNETDKNNTISNIGTLKLNEKKTVICDADGYLGVAYHSGVLTYTIAHAFVGLGNLDIEDCNEPYCGGIPSPNPEYPQEIVSVGDGGSVEVISSVFNLYDYSKDSINKIVHNQNGTLIDNENWNTSDFINIIPNTFVTFSYDKVTWGQLSISEYDDSKAFIKYTMGDYRTIPDNSLTVKLSENTHYIRCGHRHDFGLKKLLLNYGKKRNIYSEYIDMKNRTNSHKATIPLPEPLRGIPVSSGGNITIDGQEYVSDVLTVWGDGSGQIERKCYGTKFTANGYVNIGGSNLFYKDTSPKFVDTKVIKGLCSHYIGDGEIREKHVRFDDSRIYIKDSDFTNVTDFNNFFNDKTLYVIYALATPITETLTPEQTKQFLKLHTYKPNTTITNSENAYQEIEYIADTKLYIDKKFDELQATMLASLHSSSQENN